MKKIFIAFAFFAAALMAGSTACSDDKDEAPTPEPVPETKLEVAPDKLEFTAEAGESQLITVTTDAEQWTANAGEADWLTLKPEGTVLTVTAEPYLQETERAAVITVSAGDATAAVNIVQAGKVWKDTELKVFTELGGTMNKISSNGRYSVGFQLYNWSFMVDNDTWRTTIITSPEVETADGLTEECNVYDISNDGTMMGKFYSPDVLKEYRDDQGNVYHFSVSIPGIYSNGQWTPLKRLDDVPLEGSGVDGTAHCITGDGTKIGGGLHLGDVHYAPNVWSGSGYGDLVQYQGSQYGQGGMITNISDDGSVMAGWIASEEEIRTPAQWVDGQLMTLGTNGEVMAVSPNGKWTGGINDGTPFVWSRTQGLEVIEVPAGMTGGYVTGISNDGLVIGFFYVTGFGQVRYPFVITPDGARYDLDKYLESRYGYTVPENLLGEYADAPNEYLNTLQDISADGTVICGWSAFRQPWIIRLGKPTDK